MTRVVFSAVQGRPFWFLIYIYRLAIRVWHDDISTIRNLIFVLWIYVCIYLHIILYYYKKKKKKIWLSETNAIIIYNVYSVQCWPVPKLRGEKNKMFIYIVPYSTYWFKFRGNVSNVTFVLIFFFFLIS